MDLFTRGAMERVKPAMFPDNNRKEQFGVRILCRDRGGEERSGLVFGSPVAIEKAKEENEDGGEKGR